MGMRALNIPTQHRRGTVGGGGSVGAARAAGRVAACLVVLLAAFSSPLLPGATGQAPAKVGVADFYAPTPLADFFGFVPETFAANDLTDSLSRAAGGKFVVIPRTAMEQAQAAMHWQTVDVLHFERLGALAHAVGADWIVMGWIRELFLTSSGRPNSDVVVINGQGQKVGYATVVVQTFSATEGRIVGQTTKYAFASTGELPAALAARVLHTALQPAVPWLVNAVTEQAP